MDDLTAALRNERELLDQLRFRFVETRLLLAAREIRYLSWSTAEIDQARVRAREADLLRAAHVHRLVGETVGAVPGTPTLRDVASLAGQPWACMLRDHHEGLCALVSEIELIGHHNAELARGGLHEVATQSGPSLFDALLQPSSIAQRPGLDDVAAPESSAETPMSTPPGAAISPHSPSSRVDHMRSSAEHATHLADERAFQQVLTSASRLRMPALLAFLR